MFQGRLPLLIAAVFAALAALVAYLSVKSRSDEITAGWKPVDVIVAKRDLRAGESLGQDNLAIGKLPRRMVTESVITWKDHKQGLINVFGQKLAMDMHKNDPLLYQHIKTLTGDQHLAEAVQQDGRAVSIRVSAETSVHNWVEPSDRVDVVGIFRDPRSRELVAVTLLQNVIVLATGRIGGSTNRRLLSDTESAYNTVTVHVLPEAVEMLVLAQELGSLYLSLRNPEDNEIKDLGDGKTTMTTLLTGERSKRISTRQNKMFKVEIIRGGSRSTKQSVQ